MILVLFRQFGIDLLLGVRTRRFDFTVGMDLGLVGCFSNRVDNLMTDGLSGLLAHV